MNFLEVLKTEKPIELININTSKIPTFVLKLWKIVNDTELYRIISWNEVNYIYSLKAYFVLFIRMVQVFLLNNLMLCIRRFSHYTSNILI